MSNYYGVSANNVNYTMTTSSFYTPQNSADKLEEMKRENECRTLKQSRTSNVFT